MRMSSTSLGWAGRTAILLALVGGVAYLGATLGVSASDSTPTVAPSVLPYQGSLTDSVGQPLDGTFDMTFGLYDAPSGGTPLWSESHGGVNAVPVSNGLFSVNLGSISPIDVSVFDTGPLYLGIQVGSDPEMEPRQVIGSVPYALISNTVADRAITSPKIASGAVTSDKLSVEHSMAALPSNFTITSNSYQTTGLELALPGPGTYLILADVRGRIQLSSPGSGRIEVELYNSTDSVHVPTSRRVIVGADDANDRSIVTGSISVIYTVDAAKTIALRARRSGGSYAESTIQSVSGQGVTAISFVRIG